MADTFQFGIYAGSVSGTPQGLATGPADDPAATAQALDDLQGSGSAPLVVRAYLHYRGPTTSADQVLAGGDDLYSHHFGGLVTRTRKLDLVLCFHDPAGDVSGWLQYIARAVARYGSQLARLQITEEANLRFGTGAIDGDYPNVVQALVHGIPLARAELDRAGRTSVPVGFSVAPALFGPGANSFWADLKSAATPEFLETLGYLGADFFPDVFFPVALEQLAGNVLFLLQHFRDSMSGCGISDRTPLIVTESGWPTGPNRSEERQAEVLRIAVQTVLANRLQFHIGGYTWFALRDADSSKEDLFHQFGLLHSNYSRKSAFQVFADLVQRSTGDL